MMKHTKFYLLVGLLALASGCAFHRQHVVLAPVGPPPVSEAIRSTEGYLVVHSDLDVNVNDPDHNYHSSYKIFSSDGALVLTVPNHTGSFLQDPATVNLSPGRYKVVARTSN